MELGKSVTLTIPSRWALNVKDRDAALSELRSLGTVVSIGVGALQSAYMRMCDTIRFQKLTDEEVRGILGQLFSGPRISELLRVAHAPDEVYHQYRTGFFGFKAALSRCRFYRVTPNSELRARKIRRTAARLVHLVEQHHVTINVLGFEVAINALDSPARLNPADVAANRLEA